MLEFCEISKIFDTDILKKPFNALRDVSFTIPEGEISGFLGANGAGKTTSLKIAMDFIRPTSGNINYGKSLGGKKSAAFSKIGFLPERPFFYAHLTGRQFCHYMGRLSEIKKSEINISIKKWAPRFKIDFALDREIKTYSKGMLQRVGFLVTLIHNPSLIILDEPLSGLDPIGRKDLKEIIVEINKLGTTVFFSSHIVSDVEEICNTVFFLKNGEMVFNGGVEKLINDNIKSESTIKYKIENEVLSKKIADHDKNNFIHTLIKNNNEILSIVPERPSLEEIFYKVK